MNTIRYKIALEPQERAKIVDVLLDYQHKSYLLGDSALEVRNAIVSFAAALVSEADLRLAYEALYLEQARHDWNGSRDLGALAERMYDLLPQDVKDELGLNKAKGV